MILRRRRDPEPTAPVWKPRVDEARRLIVEHRAPAGAEARLDDIEIALHRATTDLHRVRTAIDQLQPDRVARELKDALRTKQLHPSAADEELIATLRRRYETTHALQDRSDDLAARIDTTVAHLESLAARAVEASFGPGSSTAELTRELDSLGDDLAALEAAHAELDGL